MLSTDALHISTLILYIYVNLQHILPHSQCSSHYLRSSELKKKMDFIKNITSTR